MLRSDHVAIIDILRGTVRGTLAEMSRGYINTDTAAFQAGYGYAYADGAFVGTALGIKLIRVDALANNHRDYISDVDASTLYST
jgi:hypothetical protein